jgi:hypothetical protein
MLVHHALRLGADSAEGGALMANEDAVGYVVRVGDATFSATNIQPTTEIRFAMMTGVTEEFASMQRDIAESEHRRAVAVARATSTWPIVVLMGGTLLVVLLCIACAAVVLYSFGAPEYVQIAAVLAPAVAFAPMAPSLPGIMKKLLERTSS